MLRERKYQLPSLSLGHNLCFRVPCGNRLQLPSPRLARNQTRGRFHPFSCPPSPVTSLVSFAEIKKVLAAPALTACLLSAVSRSCWPCSCCAWVFHSSVFSCCTSQILGHTGSVTGPLAYLPVASGIFPNQISNA